MNIRKMTTPQSPSRMFNGLDQDYYDEAKYAHEINDKMRVPKRIRATGEYSDEDLLLSNQNGLMNSWNYHDKLDMNVPDRIVVLGHNQHLETRSAPLEIQLENSILPKNPSIGLVRVQTPPRVITLNDHHFPSATDERFMQKQSLDETSDDADDDNRSEELDEDDEVRPPPYALANNLAHTTVGIISIPQNELDMDKQLTTGGGSKRSAALCHNNNFDTSMVSHREGTPMGDLTPHEEILYLRRQLAKLNRRVLNIEISNDQLLQREKIVYGLGLAYFVMKIVIWLNRN